MIKEGFSKARTSRLRLEFQNELAKERFRVKTLQGKGRTHARTSRQERSSYDLGIKRETECRIVTNRAAEDRNSEVSGWAFHSW